MQAGTGPRPRGLETTGVHKGLNALPFFFLFFNTAEFVFLFYFGTICRGSLETRNKQTGYNMDPSTLTDSAPLEPPGMRREDVEIGFNTGGL